MRLLLAGLLLVLASPAWAQDSIIVIDPNAPPSDSIVRSGPPPEVIAELIALYNDTATTRVQGDVTLPPGSRFEGRLALHRGSLRIAGRVLGSVTVVNGTLYLLPGAAIQGEILVVGGRLIRSEQVEHLGPERVYWDAAPVLRTSDGLLALRERRRSLSELATARTTFQVGRVRTTLSLATAGTYNRIEGLPILFGPMFEVRPSARTVARIDLRGILRTAGSADDLSDFGYTARADYRVLGRTEFGVGG
ncbi:MAG TPA: polymer-forming cytoskeletal protein, partial [Gemmatimonadales bacterium]